MDQCLAAWFHGKRPHSLSELKIPSTLRLVVLAPHPDDFDEIGATMRHFQQNGNRIEVAVVTSGSSGVEDGFNGAITAGMKAALRENEQLASCRFFGLPESRLTFLRAVEDEAGNPEAGAVNLQCVQSYLVAKRPDLVFLPHGNDPNEGHRRTCAFLRQSAQEAKLSLVACLNRDPKTIAMRNDLYFIFDAETAAWKAALLRLHRSQQQRNLNSRGHGFDERVLRVNREIAEELGLAGKYAEAFELECYRTGNLGAPAP
jgi:LmbE family N-acetylglucosaminyl deacetylase